MSELEAVRSRMTDLEESQSKVLKTFCEEARQDRVKYQEEARKDREKYQEEARKDREVLKETLEKIHQLQEKSNQHGTIMMNIINKVYGGDANVAESDNLARNLSQGHN